MTQDKLVFDILVVETKELTREMVKRILQQKGFSVDTAVDGKDSIDKLRRNNYAYGLVITEIIMSYAGGFEVIETVKRESSVPVMVLSAGSFPSQCR